MSEFREKLIDRMIAVYGMENEIVIEFCNLCEDFVETDWNNECLSVLVESHEACPVYLIEDDD